MSLLETIRRDVWKKKPDTVYLLTQRDQKKTKFSWQFILESFIETCNLLMEECFHWQIERLYTVFRCEKLKKKYIKKHVITIANANQPMFFLDVNMLTEKLFLKEIVRYHYIDSCVPLLGYKFSMRKCKICTVI